MCENQTTGAGSRDAGQRVAHAGWRLPLLAAAVLLGLGGRIAYSWNAPLWFDETFSGVIASQPTLAGLVRWCLAELTGPAFYMPLWVWEKLAGPSDLALRLPSLILSVGTPLAILRFGNRDADLRLWWSVFVLLWVPVFAVAGEARAYPEIFALGTAQAVVFVRLLDRPSVTRASLWVILSSLLVLCHYWSVIPGIVQGIAFLAVHRGRALRTWPALGFFLPMLAWCWFHLRYVLAFTIGGSTGVDGLPLSAILDIPAMLLGVNFNAAIILSTVLVTIVLARGAWTGTRATPERILALCGVASIAVILLLAFVRPAFAPRYATAAMPSFLFGFALWARWMMTRDAKPVILVMAMLFSTAAGVVVSIVRDPDTDARHLFELERPSAWLAERPPTHLTLFWDGPIAERSPEFALAGIGGFFLRRAGHPVDVTVARVAASDDPNRGVLAVTPRGGAGAILWLSNDSLPERRAPRIAQYDARFECRDFGGGVVTMTACRWRR